MIDEGVFARVLNTGGNAYHSHHMLALGSAYEELATQSLDQVKPLVENEPSNPIAKWVSSVTMKEIRERAPLLIGDATSRPPFVSRPQSRSLLKMDLLTFSLKLEPLQPWAAR